MSATAKYGDERLMRILLAPVITEKATMVADRANQIEFFVSVDATKPEIKAAVEMMFKVEVRSVSVLNRPGKRKRSGKHSGQRVGTRRAFVSLGAGQEINFTEGAK